MLQTAIISIKDPVDQFLETPHNSKGQIWAIINS